MEEFLASHHLTGIATGAVTFLIIGLFHPLVIKGEYYFGVRCWWVFAVLGLAGAVLSVTLEGVFLPSICGVFTFSSFWSVKELFDQRKRVAKGWFPRRSAEKKQ